jgi:hypothetical protein
LQRKLFDFLGTELLTHCRGSDDGSDDGSGRRAGHSLSAVSSIQQRDDGPNQADTLDATARQH